MTERIIKGLSVSLAPYGESSMGHVTNSTSPEAMMQYYLGLPFEAREAALNGMKAAIQRIEEIHNISNHNGQQPETD